MSEKHVKGDQRAEAEVLGHASDRRRSPRVRVLLRVEYESREDLAADYVTDLADGGLFIRTDLDLAIGTRIGLSLSFPGLLEPTLVDCVVRWRRPIERAALRKAGSSCVTMLFNRDAE